MYLTSKNPVKWVLFIYEYFISTYLYFFIVPLCQKRGDTMLNPTYLWIKFRGQLMPVEKVLKIIWSEDDDNKEE